MLGQFVSILIWGAHAPSRVVSDAPVADIGGKRVQRGRVRSPKVVPASFHFFTSVTIASRLDLSARWFGVRLKWLFANLIRGR
jgi:hypothetical protein